MSRGQCYIQIRYDFGVAAPDLLDFLGVPADDHVAGESLGRVEWRIHTQAPASTRM